MSEARYFGKLVVDERWSFDIAGFALRDGTVVFVCTANGPLPEVASSERQVVVYGEDGTEIMHVRVTVGWDAVEAAQRIELEQPVRITDATGGTSW